MSFDITTGAVEPNLREMIRSGYTDTTVQKNCERLFDGVDQVYASLKPTCDDCDDPDDILNRLLSRCNANSGFTHTYGDPGRQISLDHTSGLVYRYYEEIDGLPPLPRFPAKGGRPLWHFASGKVNTSWQKWKDLYGG